jgi:hypothetical protein
MSQQIKNMWIIGLNKMVGPHCRSENNVVILAYIRREHRPRQYACSPCPSRTAGLFILTSDNDECSFLNTGISVRLFYFISIFTSFFFFELLRFDGCYAINLPYFIIWQADNTLWQLWVRKVGEQKECNLIDSISTRTPDTNYTSHILFYVT